MLAIIFTGCSSTDTGGATKSSKVASSEKPNSSKVEQAQEDSDSSKTAENEPQSSEPDVNFEKDKPFMEKTDGDIPYEVYDSVEKQIFIKFTNNTDEIKGIQLEVTFYKGDTVLSLVNSFQGGVGAKKSSYVLMNKPMDEDRNLIPYDKIDVKLVGSFENVNGSCFDDVSIEHSKGPRGVVVKSKNNGKEVIELYLCYVRYYKAGKLIGVASSEEPYFEAGTSVTKVVATPEVSDYKPIDYDNYDVVVASAYYHRTAETDKRS